MAYVTSNPPALLVQRIGGGRAVWLYSSADAKAVVDTSGYFTDGHALGMRDGDLLLAYDTGAKIWSSHTVLNVSGTTIDAGNGTDIGVATNSD
jgi:hypothetical protein